MPRDRDASEPDLAEQDEPVVPNEADDEDGTPEIPADVPEADALEQTQPVPAEDDRRD
jgi:hypothetical protein